ncbi:hypothetical protein [Flammeovirga sp. EKP202]|uniref:hypothetical protein n=1 Tax=Flammeovirga sp. EKP202 TaxID=2770592 RepID=UPI00165FBFD7|nr:hypothetical protein [Flammeovirga sp. EKP202]MBD0404640.1 hypothetical protein [Flammeovirga sp. EKP202]
MGNRLKLTGVFRDLSNTDNLIFVCEQTTGEIINGRSIVFESQILGEIVSFDKINVLFSDNIFEIVIRIKKETKWTAEEVKGKEVIIL